MKLISIEANLKRFFLTPKNSLPYNNAYGLSRHYIDRQYSQDLILELKNEIIEGLQQFEPRIAVKNLTFTKTHNGILNVAIEYQEIKNHTIYGIFEEDFAEDFDFGKQFGRAIASPTKAFRTDGAALAQGLSTIGARAKSMGVSLEEELSIVDTAKSAFNTASEAGTAYAAFLKNANKAQKDLGLRFTDVNNKLLPMADILEQIKQRFGDLDASEAQKLQKTFGSAEAVKIITALLNKSQDLKQNQLDIKDAMTGQRDIVKETANAMNRGNGLEKLRHAIENITFIVGKYLDPYISRMANAIQAFGERLNKWLEKNKESLKAFLTQAKQIAEIAVTVGGLILVWRGLNVAILKGQQIYSGFYTKLFGGLVN